MSGIKAKKFILARRFEGEPKDGDLQLQKEDLPELKEGEILCKAVCLSVDPYMRRRQCPVGTTMIGGQVARVIESKHKGYPVGTLVVARFGWRTHTVVNPDPLVQAGDRENFSVLPDLKGLPESLGLGAIGMPGNTAYFGFLELCQPKPGDVVVVSGAAGAVGSLVGQIAKIKGCYVIGYAGSDDKVDWLVQELGFDRAFNYKKVDLRQSLTEAAPNGVDCYFDNVGGTISSIVLSHMKDYGRIAVCGAISSYNDDPRKPTLAPVIQPAMNSKELKMQGFIVNRWNARWQEGLVQMRNWILEGKIKYRETWTEGFENMPVAFLEMLRGGNTGKAVIKA